MLLPCLCSNLLTVTVEYRLDQATRASLLQAMETALKYRKDQLATIRYSQCFSLPSSVREKLIPLQLYKRGGVRRRHRAGKCSRRLISVHTTYPCVPGLRHPFRQAGIDATNLITIQTEPRKASLIPAKFNQNSFLSIVSINARSAKNKTSSLHDFLLFHDLDCLATTETWMGTNTVKFVLGEFVPDGYQFNSVPRQSSWTGGGVGVLLKQEVKASNYQLHYRA